MHPGSVDANDLESPNNISLLVTGRWQLSGCVSFTRRRGGWRTPFWVDLDLSFGRPMICNPMTFTKTKPGTTTTTKRIQKPQARGWVLVTAGLREITGTTEMTKTTAIQGANITGSPNNGFRKTRTMAQVLQISYAVVAQKFLPMRCNVGFRRYTWEQPSTRRLPKTKSTRNSCCGISAPPLLREIAMRAPENFSTEARLIRATVLWKPFFLETPTLLA